MAKVATSIRLPTALGVYVSLFAPRDPPPGSANGKPRYGLVLLYPKDTAKTVLKPFMDAALATAETRWPGKGAEIIRKMKYPLVRDGDEAYPDDPTFKGMFFIRATSVADPTRRPPRVVDAQIHDVLDDSGAYSGCTFNVSVRLFPFDKAGNRGVGVGLNNVQVVKHGPRLDGRKSPEEEFEAVEGDPTEGSLI